jgi:pyrroloquinoline quinone (PQQ) biosynthesis protein C
MSLGGTLLDTLNHALKSGSPQVLDRARRPHDERDMLLTLAAVHRLHLAPVEELGPMVRWQHHPAVAGLKGVLEDTFLEWLDRRSRQWLEREAPDADDGDAVSTIRSLANRRLVPPVYDWLADEAGIDEIRWFLALEGGPDAGFDDLVATCQIGIDGDAKLELATNYWDEMGNGEDAAVHTNLYRRLVSALELPSVGEDELPMEALRRSILTGVLATNRRLQPELIGALGTIELQAGPRCRRVVRALLRVGAGEDARAFYEEHATADPRHGKEWLDRVVGTLGDRPFWASGMIRGAAYRCAVNDDFFSYLSRRSNRELQRVA